MIAVQEFGRVRLRLPEPWSELVPTPPVPVSSGAFCLGPFPGLFPLHDGQRKAHFPDGSGFAQPLVRLCRQSREGHQERAPEYGFGGTALRG